MFNRYWSLSLIGGIKEFAIMVAKFCQQLVVVHASALATGAGRNDAQQASSLIDWAQS